jgi:hypothetical protein
MHNILPEPTCCDACSYSKIEFKHAGDLNWSWFSEWPYIYFCPRCGAAVGCHKDTNKPLGLMASSKVRKLRVKAHIVFDSIWKDELISRPKAYEILSKTLNLPVDKCHISWMTEPQLIKAIEWARSFYDVLARRKQKRKKQNIQKSNRIKNIIIQRKEHAGNSRRRK